MSGELVMQMNLSKILRKLLWHKKIHLTDGGTWERDLYVLLNSKSTGNYKYCYVDQFVLLDRKTGIAWNYFTHVHFSKKYKAEEDSTPYQDCRLKTTINKNRGLILFASHYIMTKENFWHCVHATINSNVWDYKDAYIKEGQKVDDPFVSSIKYVAENGPAGCIYRSSIPVEESLYGSNFMGSYYIFEIYARKKNLKEILTDSDIQKIQKEIDKRGLTYQLMDLNDRIGNIVCKFENETLKVKPIRLGKNGITHQFELAKDVKCRVKLHFHVEQEHDQLVYTYYDKNIVLKPGVPRIVAEADDSQCRTTITATDSRTNLIMFRYTTDQSVFSNYRAQISYPLVCIPAHRDWRRIVFNGEDILIPLNDVQWFGSIDVYDEMMEAGRRQQRWEDVFFQAQKYLNVYYKNQHNEALVDIREIINDPRLIWDLQEICIIDPYLSSKDILDTVVFCEKRDIHIHCLTDLHTIVKNKEASGEILENEASESSKFESAKIKFRQLLEAALPTDCDIDLSFRTVYSDYGSRFHDRYLILKYKINKTRVWSLGTSVNSIGKSHHIIQIVEAPTLIESFFDKVWHETDFQVCKIYESTDYK